MRSISCFSPLFASIKYNKILTVVMGPKRSASSASESASKRQKNMKTLQEKVKLLDMLQQLSAAAVVHHYSILYFLFFLNFFCVLNMGPSNIRVFFPHLRGLSVQDHRECGGLTI